VSAIGFSLRGSSHCVVEKRASAPVSEKPRLHIEPYFEHFAVCDDEKILFVCPTLRAAEIEMKHRLAQIEISEKFAA
jgi:hypothetical protein